MQIRFMMRVVIFTLLASAVQAQPGADASDAGNNSAANASAESSTSTPVSEAGSPAPSEIISRDVLVATGDTLYTIARRELGRVGYAPQLAEFNGLIVNTPLVPGNIVRIPVHVPARGEFAEVVFVKGDVIALRAVEAGPGAGVVAVSSNGTTANAASIPDGRTSINLERGSRINAGDTLQTGVDGYISIEFSSGSVINLQPETEAMLYRLNCLPNDDSCVIEIRTSRGKVTSDVENRDDQPVDFRISTPYASAAVRGTVFDIDADPSVLTVGVTEGDVDLSALDQTVALEEGFGSIVEEGEPPSQPVPLLPAPVFRRVPARLASVDTVSWWPFADAASYGGLVSNDEAGNETLASFDIDANSVSFDAIESGDYFLVLRAIDENGLQGFTSNTRITIADIDADIAPVDTVVEKQGREFLVTVLDPPDIAIGFEIQISNDDSFDDPLSVDVDATGSAVFRLDNDQVFTRARVLLDPLTVSAYGGISQSGN